MSSSAVRRSERREKVQEKVQVVNTATSDDLTQMAWAGRLRAAGGTDGLGLRAFLDRRAVTIARTILRNALEHFEPEEKAAAGDQDVRLEGGGIRLFDDIDKRRVAIQVVESLPSPPARLIRYEVTK